MQDKVPLIDSENVSESSGYSDRIAELELDKLTIEARNLKLGHSERNQRYRLRWLAVSLGLIVIFGMALFLGHVLHSIFWGPILLAPTSFSIVALAAPLISISTITIVFFIAAFRKFSNEDMDDAANLAAQGVKAASSS